MIIMVNEQKTLALISYRLTIVVSWNCAILVRGDMATVWSTAVNKPSRLLMTSLAPDSVLRTLGVIISLATSVTDL